MKNNAVEINNLSYSYPDKTTALKNISFSVSKGESIAIVGPNGSGKSTLLLHLNGILRGDGRVVILGEEIKKANVKKIRPRVGMVLQDPNNQLFMPTVFDDIAFGPINFGQDPCEVKENVRSVLEDMGLQGCENKPSYHLSLGEKKKASLATVLVYEPEILVLDEPSVSLDPGTKRVLIKIIKKINKTKIIATHDLDLVCELCSRVILIDKGMLIADGKTEDILTNRKLMEGHHLEVPASILLRERIKKN